ncbi:hypothetical protein GOODEAATRI_001330, partial [Goodea atripinnis]
VPINIQLEPQRTTAKAVTHNRLPDKHPGHLWRVLNGTVPVRSNITDYNPVIMGYFEGSYEEVNWSFKFPGCLNAADVTLERLADPVSDRTSARRYNGRPQLWQVSHGEETNAAKARALLFASVLMLTACS